MQKLQNMEVITKETVVNKLEEKGIRPSVQRMAILRYLLEHRTHPSIDEIYNQLSEQIPTLSLTTVYNTLEQFSEKGLIKAISIDGKVIHYDGYTHVHAHFLCTKCRKVFDIDQNFEIPQATVPEGFTVSNTEVYYTGTCKDCLTK